MLWKYCQPEKKVVGQTCQYPESSLHAVAFPSPEAGKKAIARIRDGPESGGAYVVSKVPGGVDKIKG